VDPFRVKVVDEHKIPDLNVWTDVDSAKAVKRNPEC